MAGRTAPTKPSSITPAVIEPAVLKPTELLSALERPQDLLSLSPESFGDLVDAFVEQGAALMAALKRRSGILAWAARHRLPDTHYGAWLHRFATTLGVSEDSVLRWRDRTVSELGLPVAARTAERSRARLAGAMRARSAIAPAAGPAAARAAAALAPAIVGSSTPPARDLVDQLLELTPEDLAESASTEELRSIKGLIEAALAEQHRVALRARLAQRDRLRSKVG